MIGTNLVLSDVPANRRSCALKKLLWETYTKMCQGLKAKCEGLINPSSGNMCLHPGALLMQPHSNIHGNFINSLLAENKVASDISNYSKLIV
jgi:hypothetical protein